jgi:microcystin-dependent protein
MTYTKHSWEEKAGTGTQKATWMNNLETQYDEMVDYLTITTHTGTYISKTTSDSTFWTTSNDGTGSGAVCYKVDGNTAAQLLAGQVTPGVIAIWSGAVVDIPSGWHLCDGRDANTPDLRGKFPRTVGTYGLGVTGGSATSTQTTSDVTIGTHALTTGEIPQHRHTLVDHYTPGTAGNDGSYGTAETGASQGYAANTSSTGNGAAHGHPGSSISGTTSNLPNYMALCYIIKEA